MRFRIFILHSTNRTRKIDKTWVFFLIFKINFSVHPAGLPSRFSAKKMIFPRQRPNNNNILCKHGRILSARIRTYTVSLFFTVNTVTYMWFYTYPIHCSRTQVTHTGGTRRVTLYASDTAEHRILFTAGT